VAGLASEVNDDVNKYVNANIGHCMTRPAFFSTHIIDSLAKRENTNLQKPIEWCTDDDVLALKKGNSIFIESITYISALRQALVVVGPLDRFFAATTGLSSGEKIFLAIVLFH
jgi:hypothetical protein